MPASLQNWLPGIIRAIPVCETAATGPAGLTALVFSKKFIQLNLKQRIESRPLPDINIVDLRESMGYRGVQRFITPVLQQAIKDQFDPKGLLNPGKIWPVEVSKI